MTHDNPRDQLWDRLTDQALDEILGQQKPRKTPAAAAPAGRSPEKDRKRFRWSKLVIAASLLLVLSGGFCVYVVAVHSTHTNWRDVVSRSPEDVVVVDNSTSMTSRGRPFGLEHQLGDRDASVTRLQIELSKKHQVIDAEIRKYQQRLGQLESLAQQVQSTVKPSSWEEPDSPSAMVKHKLITLRIGGEAVTEETVRRVHLDIAGEVPTPDEVKNFLEAARGDGTGPGQAGDRYRPIYENRFLTVGHTPLSTFSIDVDTASYSKTRRLLIQSGQLPPPDAVRIEEFINYFSYSYPTPKDGTPFAVHPDVAACPWDAKHKLLRIGIKGYEIDEKERPASNLVFLVDVSGSMDRPDKLPLVKRGLATLVRRLGKKDRVAIVVYAQASGLVLPSTAGNDQKTILEALERLQAGGSTNGGQGIRLAYQVAADNLIDGGTNRVILATDGDFNVGTTSDAELVRLVEEKAKTGVFLTALGFGVGNHNDSMLEQVADKGNGNYAYIDSQLESDKVFIQQMGGTLVTIAKDVKIQVEFNPAKVAAYRLIGYENRMLRTEDFKDDTKDAGEIGAGHTVTALYELIPAGEPVPAATEKLRYQKPSQLTPAAKSGELASVRLRYKDPEGDTSKPLEYAVKETDVSHGNAAADFKFAAAVASFGMLLRNSKYRGDATYGSVLKLARPGVDDDEHGYRAEFVELVKRAQALSGGK